MKLALDKEFCNILENKICIYFENSDNKETRGFWCDGVLFDYSDDERTVYCKAFIGKKGEKEYTLILKFGDKILSKYKHGLNNESYSIINEYKNNFCVDIEKKKIIIEIE